MGRSNNLVVLAIAIASLLAGILLFVNIDSLARFDQATGLRVHHWFRKKLGSDSVLNRELYSVGTPSGLKKSLKTLRFAAIFLIGTGFLWFAVWLASYLR
jgi:hypothetical protein